MPFQWNEIVSGCVTPDGVATLSCIPAIFLNIVNALFVFVGIVCLVLIIFSGYKYINSGGDPKKLEAARNTITHAILGLLLVLFSFFIRNIISDITGVPCVKTFGLGC